MFVCVQRGAREVKVRGVWGMVVIGVCEVELEGRFLAGGEVLEDTKIRE